MTEIKQNTAVTTNPKGEQEYVIRTNDDISVFEYFPQTGMIGAELFHSQDPNRTEWQLYNNRLNAALTTRAERLAEWEKWRSGPGRWTRVQVVADDGSLSYGFTNGQIVYARRRDDRSEMWVVFNNHHAIRDVPEETLQKLVKAYRTKSRPNAYTTDRENEDLERRMQFELHR